MMPPVGISELHMDPPSPMPYAGGGHVLLSELTPSVIEDFVAATGPGSGSPLVSAEIRHNGGELSRAANGQRRVRVRPRRVHDVRRRPGVRRGGAARPSSPSWR